MSTLEIDGKTVELPALVPAAKLTNEKYHAAPGASKSLLDQVAKSPAHLLEAINGERKPPSPAMQTGTAFHSWILEPADYVANYVVMPTFAGKGSVARRTEWVEQNAGKTIVTEEMREKVFGMARSLTRSDTATELLTDVEPELSVFWEDFENGVPCRIRIDAASRGGDYIVDLKTAQDASADGFTRAVHNFRYHVSAAMYLDGVRHLSSKIEHYYFVVVESTPPFAVGIYELDDEYLNIGRILYRRDLAAYAEAFETGEFPGYPDEIRPLSPPPFAKKAPVK